jgi:hypothetical protein
VSRESENTWPIRGTDAAARSAHDSDRAGQPYGPSAFLTIRLFANMYAGEKVTVVFLSLTYLVAPRFSWVYTCLFPSCRPTFSPHDDDVRGGAVAHDH